MQHVPNCILLLLRVFRGIRENVEELLNNIVANNENANAMDSVHLLEGLHEKTIDFCNAVCYIING